MVTLKNGGGACMSTTSGAAAADFRTPARDSNAVELTSFTRESYQSVISQLFKGNGSPWLSGRGFMKSAFFPVSDAKISD